MPEMVSWLWSNFDLFFMLRFLVWTRSLVTKALGFNWKDSSFKILSRNLNTIYRITRKYFD